MVRASYLSLIEQISTRDFPRGGKTDGLGE